VVVLFAALIAPFFINWDSYKANFEQEATHLLGHPVHVGGAAHVRILPSPSVTFTDLEVSDPGQDPIVTVETFSATIELMPLLQGEVRVTSMKLERPHLRISADDLAAVDWLKPPGERKGDKVVLGDVQISDGTLNYTDVETGVALAFGGVNASVAADSLAGPWRVDGTYLEGERTVPFRFATGRQLEDGTIRLQSNLSPPPLPISLSADGVLSNREGQGLSYAGTYTVAEVAGDKTVPTGWRSQGTFALSRGRIAIDKAVLSRGAVDRPTSVAGSLALAFGKSPSFSASAEARQLDLDRAFGGGPDQPLNLAERAQGFLDQIAALPLPTIPGRIAFNVPGVVVGGSVVQNVAFTAESATDGWKISDLSAQLPGQALVQADGVLSTRRAVSFAGHARFAVAQPLTFAAWWRGSGQVTATRLPPAFDISADATLASGRIILDKIDATIGSAAVSGRVNWGTVKGGRLLATDLKTGRVDFADVKALADLVANRDLGDVSSLADSFQIRLSADSIGLSDVVLGNVAVDASYADDTLNVVQLAVGDIGGASLRVTSGRIDELTTNPRGHLDARLEADTPEGLTLIVQRLLPDSASDAWLQRALPSLAPAVINAHITAPPRNGAGFQLSLDGVAGSTSLNATVQSAVNLKAIATWRTTPSVFSLTLDTPDSAALAAQLGLAAATLKDDPGAHILAKGNGVPKEGLDSVFDVEFAGLKVNATGKLTLGDAQPMFNGTFSASTDELAPVVASAGLTIPLAAEGTPVSLSGGVRVAGGQANFDWKDGTVAGHTVSGNVAAGRAADQSWRVDGALDVDEVDLGWLASLSLGFAPEMTGNAKAPWSKANFAPPTYGAVSGKIGVATRHFTIGDLDVTDGKLALTLQPNRIDVDLSAATLAGGAASGGASIQNVDGNATLTGQFNLTGARLADLSWQAGGQPALTGGIDLSANFEATGRTPAAIVSSITGSGVVSVHDGVAHNFNAETVQSIVRLSDLGEPFSDAALADAVADRIDRAPLAFGETGGAFTIAGGTVRANGLSARAPDLSATGGGAIDLAALTLTSDWTMTFTSQDPVAGGGDAKIGLAFRGPLAAPVRTIDVLPLNSYLSTRQAARMLDVIATEEADHIERDRLQQQIDKIRDDAARVEKARRDAIENARRRAEIAAAATERVAALHVDRETAADTRSIVMLERAAEQSAAAAASARTGADEAALRLADARAKSAAAQQALAASVTADSDAAASLAKAKADLDAAEAKAASTAQAAMDAETSATAAAQALAIAVDAQTKAKVSADKSVSKASSAADTLAAAKADAANARAAASDAQAASLRAKTALNDAGKAIADAATRRDTAAQALALATSALTTAITLAKQSGGAAQSAGQTAMQADAVRAQAEMKASARLNDQRVAEADRDQARAAAEGIRQQYMAALNTVSEAERSDPSGAGMVVLAARTNADGLQQQLQIAEQALAAAQTRAGTAAAAADTARAAAQAAAADATSASLAASRVAAGNQASELMIAQKTTARDTAAAAALAATAEAQRAGAAFNAAQADADAASRKAAEMVAAAEAAEARLSEATKASIVSAAGAEASALADAIAARAKAEQDVLATRQIADAAKAAALAASGAVAVARSNYDAAVKAADVAHAARVANEKAVQIALVAATRAESDAAVAEKIAVAREADAEAAASRVPSAAPVAATKPAVMPSPRPRPKPLKLVPDAMAGDAPLSITPAE
jgi:uncharacterized protein involved in outer membrane biogenesis